MNLSRADRDLSGPTVTGCPQMGPSIAEDRARHRRRIRDPWRMTTDWQLDEGAHAGAEHLDPVYAAGYERKAGYDPIEDVRALVAAGLGAESTVVDLGAGTGAFTIAAAQRFGRVIAVDVSAAMVAALQARTAAAGNVTVVHAGFLSYAHQGPAVDAVFTATRCTRSRTSGRASRSPASPRSCVRAGSCASTT
jgi:SAM-dependent methyltransferase